MKLICLYFQGYLESGLEFDSTSLPERGPLNFTLGTNTVIPGTTTLFVCLFVCLLVCMFLSVCLYVCLCNVSQFVNE